MDIHGPGLFSISQNHLPDGDGEDDECLRDGDGDGDGDEKTSTEQSKQPPHIFHKRSKC